LLLAIPSLALLTLAFPNFHAPDDPDHFKRSYTLLDRPFDIVTPEGRLSGAMIDSGLKRYSEEQFRIAVRPDRDRPSTEVAQNPYQEISWTNRTEFAEMPGAISYLPLLYAPQAAAIVVGRSLNLTVADTVLLGRIANTLAAVSLTWLALFLLPQGHALVLALLYLPRTMLQYASNSPDPLLFALTILIVAIALRADLHRRALPLVMSAALFLAAAVRPPLAALALLPIGLSLLQRRFRAALPATAAAIVAASWTIWVLPQIVDDRCGGDKGSLIGKAIAFATDLPALLGASFAAHGKFYYYSLIAHYGYGEGPSGVLASMMPGPVYSVAALLIAWAIRFDLAEGIRLPLVTKALLALSTTLMILLTFLAMYVACTAAGSNVIKGVQGRYIITALLTMAPVLGGILSRDRAWPLRPFVIALAVWVGTCVTIMIAAVPGLYRL
jgi:hypothetical protein